MTNDTLFTETKSPHHSPDCHTSGAEKISLYGTALKGEKE
jgi:hypothetical protein